MQTNLITVETIKSHFPLSFYERGRRYYHQGRVDHVNLVTQLNKPYLINATVRGGQTYQVKISVVGNEPKLHISSACSCPMVSNCKHVVAALLAAMDKFSVLSDTKLIQPAQHHRDHKVDAWLENMNRCLLTEAIDVDSVDDTYRLFYFFSMFPHNSSELRIKLFLVRQLKSGEFGVPKEFSPTAYAQQKHLDAFDKELLVKLEVARKLSTRVYMADYGLSDAMGETLLTELLSTGRCHWESLKNPALTLAEPKVARLLWEMDENGFQFMRCFIDKKPIMPFFIRNSWCVNENEIFLVNTGVDAQITKLLLAAPKIPPEQAKAVHDVLAENKKMMSLNLPRIFKISTVSTVEPTPCLRLSQATIQSPGSYKTYGSPTLKNEAVAALSFTYAGKVISWECKNKSICLIKEDTLTRILRNRKVEQSALDKLMTHRLLLIDVIPEIAASNPKFSHHFLLDHEEGNGLAFMADVIPVLRTEGWQIEIAEDYPYRLIDDPIDAWYSSIDEESSHDWFGLELGIMVQGEKINLLPVLQNLLPQLRINDAMNVAQTRPVLAPLADGRYIKLPTDRIRHILQILIELYDNESLTNDDSLRLSKLHAARLLELEKACGAAQLRWFGGNKLRKLANQLVQFDGIKTAKIPKTFKGKLRPYQLDGLSWLQFLREYEFGGILADDMGLGKTVQALSHIALEKSSGRMKAPVLVVAPTSLMFNWRMEAERFCPSLRVLLLHGAERKNQFDRVAEFDLVLTTYPLLVRDKEVLLKQHFYLFILDEAQFIKNAKSLATQIALQINASHRLCLTGTPMENHLGELWSLFHFLMPGLLGEQKKFTHLFRTPIEKNADEARRQHLNQRISPFLLRRTKDKVVKELPAKVEILRHVELDGAQRDLYETIRVTMQKKVRREIAKLGLARSHIIILDALLKLRQVCCDPRLLKMTLPKKQSTKSAKLDLLMTLIPELLEEGRRILLFSQFTGMLALIEDQLHAKNIAYVKLTGQTKDRQTPVCEFQAKRVPLFLISLKAGGTGLNLTAADTVIHYDPWWNPAVENQATDRAHRIGQDKTVFVYKLVAKDTVEEKILAMQQQKHTLMEGLFSDKTTSKFKLTEKDLQGLFDPLVAT